MQALTEDGHSTVAGIAGRHGVSTDAACQLLSALAAGGGRQAQFNHPDLGGMGQWSQGGMIMIGDMFNNGLKTRVAALCSDLADVLQGPSPFVAVNNRSNQPDGTSLFVPAARNQRWPAELGTPASSGSQNDLHYAIFPEKRRLAIAQRGDIIVYDTGAHRIGGVSQQQSGDQSVQFTSQSGAVRLNDLKIVDDEPQSRREAPAVAPAPDIPPAPPKSAGGNSDDEIFSRLERLADLCSRDIITAEEFAIKKAELLARL